MVNTIDNLCITSTYTSQFGENMFYILYTINGSYSENSRISIESVKTIIIVN